MKTVIDTRVSFKFKAFIAIGIALLITVIILGEKGII